VLGGVIPLRERDDVALGLRVDGGSVHQSPRIRFFSASRQLLEVIVVDVLDVQLLLFGGAIALAAQVGRLLLGCLGAASRAALSRSALRRAIFSAWLSFLAGASPCRLLRPLPRSPLHRRRHRTVRVFATLAAASRSASAGVLPLPM
jgi:hypothetical protein